MDLQKLAELLIAGGLAGLISAAVTAWKTKHDATREDRRQRTDETTGAATVAKSLTDAAVSIVKLQDDQVEEFKQQIRALQAESSALNTRLDQEIQKRMRIEALASVTERRLTEVQDQLAVVSAKFEMADQDRQVLRRENGAMKVKLFEYSVGIAALSKQVAEAGMEPAYMLEVPPIDTETRRLGPIDVQAVNNA